MGWTFNSSYYAITNLKSNWSKYQIYYIERRYIILSILKHLHTKKAGTCKRHIREQADMDVYAYTDRILNIVKSFVKRTNHFTHV